MNDPIRWAPSLVKKFSSSNHYKLLNQLKNEVKKYPLNNKKKPSSNQINEAYIDNKNNTYVSKVQNSSFSRNSNSTNKLDEVNSNKSTVSFNNAKNFSIYNQTTNNNISRQNESYLLDQSKSNDDSSTPSFKDRLDQVDMK